MDKEQKVSVILFKERKTILIAITLAIIFAVSITFSTTKRYSSHSIIYPAKSNSLNEVAVNPGFGFEIHADRTIQLIESQIIRDSLVNKFDLLKYYELDESGNDWRFKLGSYLARDIKINRTRYLSIVITVTTKNPELSADIANYIVKTVDIVKENILKENTRLAYRIYEEQLERKEHDVDSLLNLVFELSDNKNKPRKNNLLFEKRKNSIRESNKDAVYSDADAAILNIPIQNQTQRTERAINAYIHERGVLYGIKKKHNDTKEQLESPIPKSYIVSEAKPDFKKVSPSLSRNILIAIGIGLLASILFILIKYKMKEIREAVA